MRGVRRPTRARIGAPPSRLRRNWFRQKTVVFDAEERKSQSTMREANELNYRQKLDSQAQATPIQPGSF